MKINESQKNIVALSDIRRERQRALSHYGPVKVGLTTLPSPKMTLEECEARLSELLNYLEREVETLQYRSFTVYDTLVCAIDRARAVLKLGTTDTDGTDETP